MFKVPEEYRLQNTNNSQYNSDSSFGNNGVFKIKLNSTTFASIMASDGNGWEHVSVNIYNVFKGRRLHPKIIDRMPTWEEMCKIKDMFWGEDDCVIQYHPPKSEYVNNHNFILHLWRKIDFDFPIPDLKLV